jgi:hypothetical protein
VYYRSPKFLTKGEYQIELIVIRNVGTSASFSGGLFKWLLEVVECACSERRDIRVSAESELIMVLFPLLFQPNRGGHISQIGLNLGPRHARALGWASSFTLKLDDGTKALHDLDVIGAVSLTWSLIRSVMPCEILEEVGKQLEGSGLPWLATRNVKEGLLHALQTTALHTGSNQFYRLWVSAQGRWEDISFPYC